MPRWTDAIGVPGLAALMPARITTRAYRPVWTAAFSKAAGTA